MVDAVQPSLPTSAGTTGGSQQAAADFSGGDFQTFLKMLTTQIRNQDPLNPMDSSDFAVQLATFSGVEQQVRTNTLLASMAEQGGSDSISQYASWIGREVRSRSAAWFDQTPITLDVAPDPSADAVILAVSDVWGRVISREDIGPGAGMLEWFGRDESGTPMPAGSYSFAIENWKDGQLLSRDGVESYSRVVAVEAGPKGVEIVLQGGGKAAAGDITALRDG